MNQSLKKLNVAVIGQGRSGRNIHVKALTTLPALMERYRVALVCDPLPERIADAKSALNCDSTTDWRTILQRKDLDLVINASPSHEHVPITKALLEAGHHVLCEKPFTRLASEVDLLIATAKKVGRTLAVFQQARFAPHFLQLQSILASGVLGRVVQIKIAANGFSRRWDWQTMQKYAAGSLRNTGPHFLDQALQMFGDGDPQVLCRMDHANTFGDAEDHVKLIMHGVGKPTIDIEVSSCFPYQSYNYQIYATCGGLTGTMEKMEWKWFDPAQAPKQTLITTPLPERAYCSETLPWQTSAWALPPTVEAAFDTPSGLFYTALYETLVDGKPLVVTPQHVRRQIALIEECHRQNPMPVQF